MISIVIVNFNGWQDTIQCIASLLLNIEQDISIIIVDNASLDNSKERIVAWLNEFTSNQFIYKFSNEMPISRAINYSVVDESFSLLDQCVKSAIIGEVPPVQITLILSSINLGFATANNLAIHYSHLKYKNEYFWFLNNDTVINKNTLNKLVENYSILQNGNKIGILGSTLVYFDEPTRLQSLGGRLNKVFSTAKNIFANYELSSIDKNIRVIPVDFVIGASMFCDANYIKVVGLFPEEYFLYYEDVDWCLKGNKKGYKHFTCIESIVYHKEGKSIGSNSNGGGRSLLSDFYSLKNRLVFCKKNFPYFLPTTLLGFIVVAFNRIRSGKLKVFFFLFRNTPPPNNYASIN
jgi:GT2 family glycosyltransferase